MHFFVSKFSSILVFFLVFGISNQTKAQQLPANPDPNKCYVRVVSLAEYETVWDSVLTYSEEEAMIYPNRERFMETKPEIVSWERRYYEGCESDDPNDCQVLCKKVEPQEGFNYYKPKDKKKGNPYWQPFEKTVILQQGGLSSYEEIDCELTSFRELPLVFRHGSAALDEEAQDVVDDTLLRLLLERPNLRIQVNSHTSSRGPAALNQALTERRSRTIADYLVSRGIDRRRLITKGFGESQLKNRCTDGVECSEEEHALNQRIEFRVLNVDY